MLYDTFFNDTWRERFLGDRHPPDIFTWSKGAADEMESGLLRELLAGEQAKAPASVRPMLGEFWTLYQHKQWHQLTEACLRFFNHPGSAGQRVYLYEKFFFKFADKINNLKRVSIALSVSTQYDDNRQRLTFLQDLATAVNTSKSQAAHVFALTNVALVQLKLGNLQDARFNLDKCQVILDSIGSVDNIVNASFYCAQADYFAAKQDYTNYYYNSLLYLACVDVEKLGTEESHQRAYALGIAALLSKKIYNFGELLLHSILRTLDGTPQAWLKEALVAFNRGNLAKYHTLMQHIKTEPDLKDHIKDLNEKIRLSALTGLVFKKPLAHRVLTMQEIVEGCQVNRSEADHLVMRALSLKIIRGTINGVDGNLTVSWVQPRVLSIEEITEIKARLDEWDRHVESLGKWVEKVGDDVWAG